ncbi:MAG: two-component sensor histidine kinase [Planctomycetaceae bacterium]|jgi:signal transduction histidine kinase|nr:two-component sensor histidine kinase [Planctomycetaceae bacterium]
MTDTTPQDALQDRLDALQEHLRQAQKMGTIGAIAASTTHEFNNILTTVINYAKMGLRHTDDETREKAFTKILAAGQRAAKITTGMLAYSRNGGDRKEPIDLAELVSAVVVLVEKDLQKHRVGLEIRLEDPVYAEVNTSQIQQVLLNLIINARQAMEDGGQLTIAVRSDSSEGVSEIEVADTGSGMAPETLGRIFDSFFSTKTADDQGQGGTGLGLSLCREIIESHQGRIRVESAVGRGTRFTLRFPLVEAPSSAAA